MELYSSILLFLAYSSSSSGFYLFVRPSQHIVSLSFYTISSSGLSLISLLLLSSLLYRSYFSGVLIASFSEKNSGKSLREASLDSIFLGIPLIGSM